MSGAEKSNGPRFSYDSGYLATPNATAISRSLPLVGESFPLQSTRAFFDGLIPEGPMREAFERSTRAGRNDFLTVLEAVRNEPIGALVFSHDDDLDNLERAYEPIDIKGLERLAVAPGETAVEYELSPDSSVDSISLAGNAAIASGEVSMGVKRPNLRALMKRRCGEGKGLVVTIDEVQDAPLEAMQLIAGSVQHLIREKENISLVFAGLPMGVMDLINGKALTFLRRAQSEELDFISLIEVKLSFKDGFAASGLILDDDQLEIMAHATEGYAYLIQLIGYYVWRFADLHRASSMQVSDEDMRLGVENAMTRFHEVVHEPAISKLTKGAMEYLVAMAREGERASTADVAKRMGREPKATSSFRRSLIQHEVIQSPVRGYVEFSVPFLREYVLDNAEELLDRY